MQVHLTENSFQTRIEAETGRKITQDRVTCSSCDGLGFSQFEDPCVNCVGEGKVTEWIFRECGHEVESTDCQDDGCNLCTAGECDNGRAPGETLCVPCLNVWDDARATYRKPYSVSEIDDAYSDPTEAAKRESMVLLGD